MTRSIGLLAVMAAMLAGAAPGDPAQPLAQPLSMDLQGLRSTKGRILVCVTRSPDYFPDCTHDPDRRHFTVAATTDAIPLGSLVAGDYAIAIIHDENGNGKLDTFAGIPREGVGFSRNPAMTFGPPKWEAARFHVASGPGELDVKLKYFL